MALPEPYYRDERADITIYCGDSLEILPELPRVGLVCTDPPYGVEYAEWDDRIPPLAWLEWCREHAGVTVFTPGNANQRKYPQPTWTLCWARPGSIQRAGYQCFSHWEPVLVYAVRNPYTVDLRILPANTGAAHFDHPCPKPLALASWLIQESKTEGVVLDPFMGSGTTLRAAKDLGRPAIGIDISEAYCAVAVSRLGQEVFSW